MKKKQSESFKTIKAFWRENMRHKKLFFPTIGFWTTGILLQKLLLPVIIAISIDKIIIIDDTSQILWSDFYLIFFLFILVAAISQILIDFSLLLLSKLEVKIMPIMYDRIYKHLVYQSSRFHADSFAGSLVAQTTRYVKAYQSLTDILVLNISQILILTVLSSVVTAFYSPLLALVIISWSIFYILLNLKLTKRRIILSKEVAKADTKITGYLADSIGNVGAIRSFAKEKEEISNFKSLTSLKAKKHYIYWVKAIKNDATFGLLMSLLQIIVLITSIFLIQRNQLSIGAFVLTQVYITQIIANLWGLSGIMRNIEQQLSDASEMTEILEQPGEVKNNTNVKLAARRGEITLDNVVFRHADSDKKLFNGFTLKIKPGEKVGLVGSSGGGKTSLTKLLLRFSDIESGSIKIDGQDISEVTQESLRENITHVPQEPLLFHRSIAENILYGNTEASEAELLAVSKLAHSHEFIDLLPKGYDTVVGERGTKLSGGQRQRVAIARAMLKNAPILVLDEATSALDSESESLIQDALWNLMENRTAIVIAHRLSTIQKMDRIIVLDKGKIIEEGTHKELLTRNGVYSKFWQHQSGGFLE